ncbi:MAG: TolC family protein [Trueperaceae bacterium]
MTGRTSATGRTALRPWRLGTVLAAALIATAAPYAVAQPESPAADGSLRDTAPEASFASDRSVRAFLDALDGHPGVRAARAGRTAAERELDGLRSPFAVDASVGFSRVDARRPEEPLPPPLDGLQEPPDGWSHQGQLDLRVRPFLVGDLADAEAQLHVSVLRAERSVRETRASLEAAALQAATSLHLAERGLRLADAGVALAERARDATRTRHELGAATDAELRRAEAAVTRAEDGRRSAVARLRSSERTVRDLVGDVPPLSGLPDLDPVDAPDPNLLQAEEDRRLAEIGVASAERALYPVAQAAYAWNLGDDSLSVSLESRTLQPTVSYQTPGSFGGAAGGGILPDANAPRIDGSFTIGVSMTLSPESFYALDGARARLAAADAGVQAARTDAERARAERDDALRAARAELELARLDLDLAEADARDTERRVEAGLSVPLESAERALAASEARLALDSARLTLLSAVLRSYRELAVPPSEALP